MSQNFPPEARELMNERFRKNALLALATTDGRTPSVRAVNGYYEDGAFYIVTHALSRKMKQIEENPRVALCGERFNGHGLAENLGPFLDRRNEALAATLRQVFAFWYDDVHIDEADPNTCILRIRLTDGVLFAEGKQYDIQFTES